MFSQEVQIGGDGLLEQRIRWPWRGEHAARKPAVGVDVQEDADGRTDAASSAGTSLRKPHLEIALHFRLVKGRWQRKSMLGEMAYEAHPFVQMLTHDHGQVLQPQQVGARLVDAFLVDRLEVPGSQLPRNQSLNMISSFFDCAAGAC